MMEVMHSEAHKYVGEGWKPLVQKLVADLEAIDPTFVIFQVKEKFGGLRFYTGGLTSEQHDLVEAAEAASYKTCERCGEPGTQTGGGWILTLCATHQEERREALAKIEEDR